MYVEDKGNSVITEKLACNANYTPRFFMNAVWKIKFCFGKFSSEFAILWRNNIIREYGARWTFPQMSLVTINYFINLCIFVEVNVNLLFMKYLIKILLIHFTYRITNLASHAISCSCKLFPLQIRCILWIKMKYNFKFANNLTNNRTIYDNNIFIDRILFFECLINCLECWINLYYKTRKSPRISICHCVYIVMHDVLFVKLSSRGKFSFQKRNTVSSTHDKIQSKRGLFRVFFLNFMLEKN